MDQESRPGAVPNSFGSPDHAGRCSHDGNQSARRPVHKVCAFPDKNASRPFGDSQIPIIVDGGDVEVGSDDPMLGLVGSGD